MNETVKAVDIPNAIQQAIVGAALDAAINALNGGHTTLTAAEHARTLAEAGVRAWQIANGAIPSPVPCAAE